MWSRNRNGFKGSEQDFESVCLANILRAITAGSTRLAACSGTLTTYVSMWKWTAQRRFLYCNRQLRTNFLGGRLLCIPLEGVRHVLKPTNHRFQSCVRYNFYKMKSCMQLSSDICAYVCVYSVQNVYVSRKRTYR